MFSALIWEDLPQTARPTLHSVLGTAKGCVFMTQESLLFT